MPSEQYRQRSRGRRAAEFTALGLALLLMVQVGWQAWSKATGTVRFASVEAGDPLVRIPLNSITLPLVPSGSPHYAGLDDLFDGACGVAVFYLSTCPASRHIAPFWSATRRLEAEGHELPIAWIGLPADSGATNFLKAYDLQGHHVVARSLHDWGALGVRGTPTVYLVKGDRLIRRLPSNPNDLRSSDVSCDPM